MNLLNIANVILVVVGITLIVPCSIFFIECLAAFTAGKSNLNLEDVARPKTTVLIPAHNEAEQIVEVLEILQQQITEQDRVIVIADNCHDKTAELARGTGVTVFERENKSDRGKGYALDYAMERIKDNPPEVLVILDGDCIIAPNTIKNITCKAIATGRPVQSTYLMEQPENTSLKDNISTFSLKVKNLVRLLGLNRLGWHCLLTGSGMAFPWPLISSISLAGSKTTDDMQLTVDLALAGSTPVFCENALVMGRLMKDEAATSQRSRWEHGHLEMILVEVPRLLKAFVKTGNFAALGLALDIFIPPLSLLVMAWMGTAMLTWLAVIFGGISLLPAILVSIAGAFLIAGVLLAWVRFGRSDLPLKNLIAIPFYILSKIPIYLKFLVKPQSRWLKTERDLPEN
ncbi:glycosyltransferase [Waterburya agarophytonicola K14]|uniref:Glycosyltransferase n=1 Tax=Waterburya agarophytonicola KI4 TaxID=2874699 RepID=A0A964BWU5_9CYAN|nr:glycosyltransferase family 2 protein [Waterburya agarophytonicola]MCC0179162.1 glycosyltransferase [Waterburya agarophytonicola KI4]